jgi:hypothetical protein
MVSFNNCNTFEIGLEQACTFGVFSGAATDILFTTDFHRFSQIFTFCVDLVN